MEATARTLYSLIEDFDNREEARRREEYYARVKRLEDTITEKDKTITIQQNELEQRKIEIEKYRKLLAEHGIKM